MNGSTTLGGTAQLCAAALVACAPEPEATESSGSTYSVTVVVSALGETLPGVSIAALQPGSTALDAYVDDLPIYAGTSGEPLILPVGPHSIVVGDRVDPSGDLGGSALHIDDEGTHWIAPAVAVEGSAGQDLTLQVDLNFLALGDWTCVSSSGSGISLSAAGPVLWSGGEIAEFPALGAVRVQGLEVEGADPDRGLSGLFVDAETLEVDEASGDTSWLCCIGYGFEC